MAVNLTGWLSGGSGLPTAVRGLRAAAAWRRIQDKPTSVTFRKPGGTTLAAQTVRVESADGASIASSAAGNAPVRGVVIFGVRDHATVTSTDVGEGYRFVLGGDEYTVIDVIETLGEVQAVAVAVG